MNRLMLILVCLLFHSAVYAQPIGQVLRHYRDFDTKMIAGSYTGRGICEHCKEQRTTLELKSGDAYQGLFTLTEVYSMAKGDSTHELHGAWFFTEKISKERDTCSYIALRTNDMLGGTAIMYGLKKDGGLFPADFGGHLLIAPYDLTLKKAP